MQIGSVVVVNVKYSCLSNATCGCSRNSAVLSRIVGGESAKKDTWGWMVSICRGNNHICGGSLISSTLVLTAAHCVIAIKSISSLRINVGSKYLSSIQQQRNVSNIYIHQEYDGNTFINDIALIRLESSVNMTDPSIAVICIPSVVDTEYPPTGDNVVAIGWGVLLPDDKTPSDILQQVTLNVISNSAVNCHNTVHNTDNQFCAGVQGGGKGIRKKFCLLLKFERELPFFSLKILAKVIVVVH
jgi:trypsin